MAKRAQTPRCSFCGKTQANTGQLIAGPRVSICEECVGLCSTMLQERDVEGKAARAVDLVVPKPHKIKEYLDRYVIGQDETKKVLSVAVHNHYKRIRQESHFDKDDPYADVEIEKSNILLVGPTGSGKTLLARTLATCLDVPFSIADATTLTEAGYVGEDVENILLRMIQAADHDIGRAELGIIYIDEIDKIGRRTENVSITRDVSGEGVQQALLKILEGTVANVPKHGGRKHPQQEYIKMNTRNILFVCGGAFVGLDGITKRRVGKQILGFCDKRSDDSLFADKALALPCIQPEDLLKFGLIPELIGRLPVLTTLSELTKKELMRILVEPKNCMVRQYQKLIAMEGVELTFTESALSRLAQAAVDKGTGARGLRSTLEEVMLDVMYEAPRRPDMKKVKVSKNTIDGRDSSFSGRSEKTKIA